MRKPFKAAAVSIVILNYVFYAIIAKMLVTDRRKRRSLYLEQVKRHCRIALQLMGVNLQVEGLEHLKEGRTYLILGNHMSWLDALILASLYPACFITSYEMKETPVLGLLTELGGCLYTERRNRENIKGEVDEIAGALREGFSIVIFPEATSTNGERVLPFKRSLLASAVHAKTPVLPLVIQYESLDGEKVTKANRDALCWYGDMTFGPHFYNMMRFRNIGIKVKLLPEIPIEKDATRDTLVEKAYAAITGAYEPIL